MKKAELKMLFKDLREHMNNVSPDPDAQRFDYQTTAINALTVIKQTIDTGLEEDADQLHNAYHNGYEQGRFDEYANRMGREKAEKVKARIDRQKNCPYCHYPFQSVPLFRGEIFLQIVEDGGEYRLMVEGNCDSEDIGFLSYIVDGRVISGCPFCGRPLNEEEE